MQQIATAVERALADRLFPPPSVFDGVSRLYSTCGDIVREGDEQAQVTIDLEGHTLQRPNQITITVLGRQRLNFSALISYLQAGRVGTNPGSGEVLNCLHALTAMFRDFPANRAGMISRPNASSFFKRVQGLVHPLPSTGGVLEALTGLHQAVTVSFGGQLAMNVDSACSAFYTPDLLFLNVARAFAGIKPTEPLNAQNVRRLRDTCSSLTGLFFTIKHQRRNGQEPLRPKAMRVKSVSPGDANSTSFERVHPTTNQKETISVAQYFKERYGITLTYPNLPLVISQRDDAFPLELCYTPEGERYQEALQGAETSDFIRACTTNARLRRTQIQDHLKRLGWHSQPLLQGFGIAVSTSELECRALLLPLPVPNFGSGSDVSVPRSGSFNLQGKRFKRPCTFKSWGLLYLGSSVPDQRLQAFCRDLVRACSTVGMTPPSSPPAFLRGNPSGVVKDMIGDLVRKTSAAFGTRMPDVLFILLHQGMDPSIYKAIKGLCEVEGIVSQVMLVEKSVGANRGLAQYTANIALKLNVKLGGMNWSMNEKLYGPEVMFLGGDVSHPSPAELRRPDPPPSYCGLTASMDSACSLYTGIAGAQAPTQEFMDPLGAMFDQVLRRFEKRNNRLPKHIIYWRDGLSDSQVAGFEESELKALLGKCNLKMRNSDLMLVVSDVRTTRGLNFKLTVINAIKRHHTRFFPQSERHSDKNGNIVAGCVVENSSDGKDFFAVTQAALQGVVRPTHYRVLHDENNLSAEDLQRLVVAGCMNYQRATRSVGLHPAVYYAHHVAARGKFRLRTENGQTVLKDVHERLRSTMWWL